jgi:hypothetical protein
MDGGTGIPGLTREANSPCRRPPRTRTAPISVIAAASGDQPVVSRSTTANSSSASGTPPYAAGGRVATSGLITPTKVNPATDILATAALDPIPAGAQAGKCQRPSLRCARPFTECQGDGMMIDCGCCVRRGADCQDCVVTALGPSNMTGSPEQAHGYLDEAEVRALSVLADAGMVPPLRLSLPGSIQPGSRISPRPRTWVLPDSKAS